MSSVEKTATALLIQHTPWLERLVGALFIAGGTWPLLSGEPLFGAGFMIAGALIITLFANAVTTRFDRAAGCFTRSMKGIVRSSAVRHPLAAITGVRVHATNSGNSPSQSYRVEVVLKSRDRVPIASGYSSGKADKERLAAEIRQFLNLDDAAGDAPGFGEMAAAMFDRERRS